jgi:hypothetical protein
VTQMRMRCEGFTYCTLLCQCMQIAAMAQSCRLGSLACVLCLLCLCLSCFLWQQSPCIHMLTAACRVGCWVS